MHNFSSYIHVLFRLRIFSFTNLKSLVVLHLEVPLLAVHLLEVHLLEVHLLERRMLLHSDRMVDSQQERHMVSRMLPLLLRWDRIQQYPASPSTVITQTMRC